MHDKVNHKLWINTQCTHPATKMHPVMSNVNKAVYWISDDERTLCFDVGDAFGERRLKRPIRYYSAGERTEMIHSYLEDNLPPFCDNVDALILKMGRFGGEEHFVLDDERLLEYFPNLGIVCCNDVFDLTNGEEYIYMLDAFDLGEMCFNLARDGDFEMANHFTRELWALDHKWARFFREVAVDFRCPREYRVRYYPNSEAGFTGLDKLFRIYLLGWYSKDSNFDERVRLKKHKSLDKAIGLLKPRFENRDMDEVADKLYWDLKHIEKDEAFDLDDFEKVICATESLLPGIREIIKRK